MYWEQEYEGKRVMVLEDSGAREKKERKTEVEVVEMTCRGEDCQGRKRKTGLRGGDAYEIKKHRPYIKVGKDAEED